MTTRENDLCSCGHARMSHDDATGDCIARMPGRTRACLCSAFDPVPRGALDDLCECGHQRCEHREFTGGCPLAHGGCVCAAFELKRETTPGRT